MKMKFTLSILLVIGALSAQAQKTLKLKKADKIVGRTENGERFDWVIGNVIFGVVFVLLGFLVVYACSKMFGKYAWWQSALDGIAGESLKRAKKDVEIWRSLQHEGKG